MSERGAADIEFSVRRCANVVASVPLERMVVMVMQLLVVVTRNALMELLREFLGADHSALSIGIFMEGDDERQSSVERWEMLLHVLVDARVSSTSSLRRSQAKSPQMFHQSGVMMHLRPRSTKFRLIVGASRAAAENRWSCGFCGNQQRRSSSRGRDLKLVHPVTTVMSGLPVKRNATDGRVLM